MALDVARTYHAKGTNTPHHMPYILSVYYNHIDVRNLEHSLSTDKVTKHTLSCPFYFSL